MASSVAVSVTAAVCRVLEREASRIEIESPPAATALHRTATWLALQTVNDSALPETLSASVLEALGRDTASPITPDLKEQVRRGGF